MKAITATFFLLSALGGLNAQASSFYTTNSTYTCSDGETYGVARTHMSDFSGNGKWKVGAFCKSGTLTPGEYNGFPKEDSLNCYGNENDALNKSLSPCFEEFKSINTTKGTEPDLPLIINHESQTGKETNLLNCPEFYMSPLAGETIKSMSVRYYKDENSPSNSYAIFTKTLVNNTSSKKKYNSSENFELIDEGQKLIVIGRENGAENIVICNK